MAQICDLAHGDLANIGLVRFADWNLVPQGKRAVICNIRRYVFASGLFWERH
jgi:hypothetical protein